ncbi:hypothetical protein [Evansella tamaricis]|uniref:Uncharacterized protein n=1 Tax=Evansella tamaricis TaxID=2069301 RepID=A0ABS6JC29_9BACI|nr:hypothetical protein [Evansella tamaricis]MBU9711048.1 hypothetical protein [Evansella tamaricis]
MSIKREIQSRLVEIEAEMYRLDQEAAQLRASLGALDMYEMELQAEKEEAELTEDPEGPEETTEEIAEENINDVDQDPVPEGEEENVEYPPETGK